MISYINFGPPTVIQKIGTASGMLHREAPNEKRPYCEHCGVRARYQRKVANGYRCRECDEEGGMYGD